MKEPTQSRIKVFWEWYGVKPTLVSTSIASDRVWTEAEQYPTIDLNNLFKYAVPKAIENGVHHIGFGQCGDGWLCYLNLEGEEAKVTDSHLVSDSKDPALALFWALDKVREANNGKSRH